MQKLVLSQPVQRLLCLVVREIGIRFVHLWGTRVGFMAAMYAYSIRHQLLVQALYLINLVLELAQFLLKEYAFKE